MNESLCGRNARFAPPTLEANKKCYFQAIPSYKVELDILCGILLNESLSGENARFGLPTLETRRKCYFKAIPSYKVEIDI